MNDDIDIFEDAEMPVHEDGLGRLSGLFARRTEVENRVEEAKAALKVAEEELRKIDEKDFPELFDEVGISSFKVGNREISVQEKLYGSLPKSEEAKEYLRNHGGEGLFKTTIEMAFGKGEGPKASELAHELELRGLEPSVGESVHASTLQAWVREQLGQGVVLDLDTLGLYNRRFIKVK